MQNYDQPGNVSPINNPRAGRHDPSKLISKRNQAQTERRRRWQRSARDFKKTKNGEENSYQYPMHNFTQYQKPHYIICALNNGETVFVNQTLQSMLSPSLTLERSD
jgi:hypothetical protein